MEAEVQIQTFKVQIFPQKVTELCNNVQKKQKIESNVSSVKSQQQFFFSLS